MKSSIVIGANYGDEGKGLMTDYLCKKYNADLVVRFNGGAQAGHTVVTPEGERHVFSHIGSGYFLGVPTYLSKHFILNPILFKKEYIELKIPKDYKIYISQDSLITTYWDMLANRAMEEMRGDDAHGSCGVGINATIERAEKIKYDFSLKDVGFIKIFLSQVCNYWKGRLTIFSLKINKPLPEWVMDCFSRENAINEQFLDDLRFMWMSTRIFFDSLLEQDGYAIFEGAQGLALDQFYGNYPYVTRSNTGMRNVLEMQRKEQGAFSIDEIVYVSRTYETRHGNDPYFKACDITLEGASDKTNVKNEWQGMLFYRELLYNSLGDRVRLDLRANNLWDYKTKHKVRFVFTHLDQIPLDNSGLVKLWKQTDLSVPLGYTVNGETRNNVDDRIAVEDK
jgi:adenylosuccinate synthase